VAGPGLVADVMDDRVFQTRFDDHPGPGRRSLDDLPELGFSHRTHQRVVVLQEVGQDRVCGTAAVEVRPDGQDDENSLAGLDRLDERLDEAAPFRVVVALREDLLELVYHQQQTHLVGLVEQDLLDGQAERAGVLPQLPGQRDRRKARQRRYAQGHLLDRVRTRRHDHRLPACAAGQGTPHKAGSSPARTTDDLPLPDGPMTPRNWASANLATRLATSSSRPKKNLASSGWKAARPLYGHGTSAGGGAHRVDRRRPRPGPVPWPSLLHRDQQVQLDQLLAHEVVLAALQAELFGLSIANVDQGVADLAEHPTELLERRPKLRKPLRQRRLDVRRGCIQGQLHPADGA
jgi:hypothetical protein